MKEKFSEQLISHAIEFTRVANEELGEMAEEKVNAMFDAFDPGLRKQIFMQLLMGPARTFSTIKRISTPSPQKIQAIKEIRGYLGIGLKEAKDITDAADINGTCRIEHQLDYEKRNSFAKALRGTGYELF